MTPHASPCAGQQQRRETKITHADIQRFRQLTQPRLARIHRGDPAVSARHSQSTESRGQDQIPDASITQRMTLRQQARWVQTNLIIHTSWRYATRSSTRSLLQCARIACDYELPMPTAFAGFVVNKQYRRGRSLTNSPDPAIAASDRCHHYGQLPTMCSVNSLNSAAQTCSICSSYRATSHPAQASAVAGCNICVTTLPGGRWQWDPTLPWAYSSERIEPDRIVDPE